MPIPQPARRVYSGQQQYNNQQAVIQQHNINMVGLKLLLVGNNDCYARAAFQFLVPLEVIT